MTRYYFDWSIRNGVYVIDDDAQKIEDIRVYASLAQAIDQCQSGDTLIGEATFESFDLDRRYSTIAKAQDRGVTLLTTPNRLTGKHRRKLGIPDTDKADEVDVFVIRDLAQDESKLKAPSIPDPAWIERRKRANRHLMMLRRTGTLTPKPRRPDRFNFLSQKDIQAAKWVAQLPPYQDQPEVRQRALGDGKGYNFVIVAAVGVAAAEARNTREFDALSGLYAHAYPTQIRADLHHYAWAGGNTRAKLRLQIVDGKRVVEFPSRRVDGLTMSEYRRECRWLWHHLRPIVIS